MLKNKAVFLDRDGVINATVDRGDDCVVQGKKVRFTAPWSASEFKLLPGVRDSLEKLSQGGWRTIVVTNQPDLAYGTLSLLEHEKIMAQLRDLPFDDVFVCPHGRAEGCDCKKPKPGMLLAAAKKWDLELKTSFIIGDSPSDAEAGLAAGVRTILIPDQAADLAAAVDIILAD